MARLNIKSTKAAFVKTLKSNEVQKADYLKYDDDTTAYNYCEGLILALARDLEIEIKPEDYK